MKMMGFNELIHFVSGNKQTKPLASFKVILPLRGFAIFFVVLAHAAIMMLADDVSNQNAERVSALTIGHWQIISFWKSAILEICRFSVPLFLFLSGYYLLSTPRTWKSIWSASRKLLFPMLFWSVVGWAFSWRHGNNGWSLWDFSWRLINGKTQMGFFFVILIIQYYVISYWLVPVLAKRPVLVLTGAFLIQTLVFAYDYAYLLASMRVIDAGEWILRAGPLPEVLFVRFIFSFTLGIWAATETGRFREILINRFPAVLLISLAALFLLFLERGLICGYGSFVLKLEPFGATALSWVEWKLSTFFWSIAAIFLCFGIFIRRIPLKPLLDTFGKYSLQIFLLHGVSLTLVDRLLYKILDTRIYCGALGVILLLFFGLTLPVLGAKLAQRTFPPGLRALLIGS